MRAPAAAHAAVPAVTVSAPTLGRASRVFVALLIVGLAPLLLVTNVVAEANSSAVTDLSVANLRSRSASTASAIDGYIQARKRDIVNVSLMPDVIAYAQNLNNAGQRDLARAALAGAASATPAYESIAVLSLDGTIAAASIQTDEGTNVRFRDYFQNARAGVQYISDPSYSVITNKPALFFSAPVKTTDGVLVGVVRSRVNLSQIWDLVESDQGSVGAGAHAFLIDDYGIRLAVSETKGNRDKAESLIYKPIAPIDHDTALRLAADKRFGQMSAEQLVIDPLPELKSSLDAIARAGSLAFKFATAGTEQRAAATRLDSKPWVYVIAMPPSSYVGVLASSTRSLVIGIAVELVLALVATAWVIRTLAVRGVPK